VLHLGSLLCEELLITYLVFGAPLPVHNSLLPHFGISVNPRDLTA
jgi:hypothetical protein